MIGSRRTGSKKWESSRLDTKRTLQHKGVPCWSRGARKGSMKKGRSWGGGVTGNIYFSIWVALIGFNESAL